MFNDYSSDESLKFLEKTYLNILDCARSNFIKVLVIPALGTGVAGYNVEEATDIAISVVKKYLTKYDMYFEKIIFNVFNDDIYKVYENKLKNIA